jgi:hypothetical protein
LKLDGHAYSPTILHRMLHMAGIVSSFDVAQVALAVVGEISVSDRQINELAVEVGRQLQQDRDRQTARYVEQDLPRQATQVEPAVDLAAVFCDGGRMRTRTPGRGRGVHEAHWRETKNAAFYRMQSQTFEEDPQFDLPECFRNQTYVEKLVNGLKGQKKEGREEEAAARESSAAAPHEKPHEKTDGRPKILFRTCLSSLAGSNDFGPMMAAEADRRGFFTAKKKAFLADGLPYNWSIQQRHFPKFEPIVDFVHVVEYLYTTAKAIHSDVESRWQQYLKWAVACWQGRVSEVIDEITQYQSRFGSVPPGEKLPDSDPRQAIHSTLSYLTNNQKRMDYSRYRRHGLPATSSLAESYVKQVNQRVKGTEKFWNDNERGEAILQIRAAVLGDDDRLANWIRTRPISPFSPRCRSRTLATSV